MWRHIAANTLTLLIVLVFLTGGAILYGQSQYNGPGPLAQAMCLKVDRGSNFSRVSRDLAAQGAISSAPIFRLGVDYGDKSGDLKAGSYLIEPGSSMAEIVDVVTRGGASTCGTEMVFRIGVTRQEVQLRELDPQTNRYVETAAYDPTAEDAPAEIAALFDNPADTRIRVAVAEGATSWQIVEGLKSVPVLTGDAEVPAEGTLAPDSYEVRKGDTVKSVLDRMVAAQERILAEAWEGRDADIPLDSPEEALILASIIEKETGVAAERGQVASVFVNRLRRGMRLQTDPTVIYGITKGQGVLGRGLRQSELRRATPYNTYVIPALPPTPIANPGRAAIEAAVNPDSSRFLFFVADGTGGHAFAETLEQHNRNVAEWRKIEAERANQ
ncbi:endolytic transglycosylase MltG [Pseudaestuariivita atlantica]|uniref:Endolytic murein transglycosylase n=1 Tax=Pseudaestuariivita atlantica TaxID=1317121 RepID=A0A0L1JLX1_9RHOB|nr:endolytic transglycosylase MltG [Pseudaestuariivita atlantica]KNG92754.1 branched-chain alpha-keto acid dehydrogenase subunit E2 [Pseudaestuariivita atlantica]